MNKGFLPQKGAYRKLRCYQLAEHIYDATFVFCERFIGYGDRTKDQMVQAARSGKQNIAEGSAAATTSTKTEIHLTNVAKASLQELLADYEDYLTVRSKEIWQLGDRRLTQTREVLRREMSREYIVAKARSWDDTTLANVAITMIHQCDYLLQRLLESQKQRVLENGGISEEMTRARLEYRKNQKYPGNQSAQSTPRTQSSPSTQSNLSSPNPPKDKKK